MKHIISLNFSGLDTNNDEIISFMGETIRVTQFNLSFDFETTKHLIRKYDGVVDAFCLSGVPPSLDFKGGGFIHPQVSKLKACAKITPITDGNLIKRVYLPWAIKKYVIKNPRELSGKRLSFYSGVFNYHLIEELELASKSVQLGDPYFFLKLPFTLTGKKKLDKFAKFTKPLFRSINLKRSNLNSFGKIETMTKDLEDFYKADFFVGTEKTFNHVSLEHLKGRSVIVDFANEDVVSKLKKAQVKKIIATMPNIKGLRRSNFSIIEACLQVALKDQEFLDEDMIINWIEKSGIQAYDIDLATEIKESASKFAFIIHPLGKKHIFNHRLLRPLSGQSDYLGTFAEEFVSYFNGFYYGSIKGIVSEKNGKEVEGLIYSVTETPKKLLEKDPNSIYRKLVALSEQARTQGANIIGLGAYTKIVGDAGVTVANHSPIPVTTGNSLSACATLWAAKFALEKMNLVEFNEETQKYNGRVMVVGATGSIGAVSAKILANGWREIILVAPRAHKILELKEKILETNPEAQILISTKANTYIQDCDLIITTTSARGKKILDIDKVKPGAIICDVSRPFDISEEDALRRPDVMVIASGEVKLPGPVDMKIDIGLEGNIVYACLAETAILAMEGKYENFTLSRQISYEKVLEIDRLAHEHGVRLSCIMGHNGFITDDEFMLCRQHALAKIEGN